MSTLIENAGTLLLVVGLTLALVSCFRRTNLTIMVRNSFFGFGLSLAGFMFIVFSATPIMALGSVAVLAGISLFYASPISLRWP